MMTTDSRVWNSEQNAAHKLTANPGRSQIANVSLQCNTTGVTQPPSHKQRLDAYSPPYAGRADGGTGEGRVINVTDRGGAEIQVRVSVYRHIRASSSEHLSSQPRWNILA